MGISMRIRTAVFPVAGLGTRFLPATKAAPKELLPVLNKPLLQYAIEEARAAGVESFVFVHARGKSILEDQIDRYPALEALLEHRGKHEAAEDLRSGTITAGDATFVRQPEALGLGHAIWCARRHIGAEPFAVILPDDLVASEIPCLKQMAEAYQSTNGMMVAAMPVEREEVSKYGIIDPGDSDGALIEARGIVEKPTMEDAPSNVAVIGRYILPPEIMHVLENTAPGAGGEIQLTDAIATLSADQPLHGFRFEGERFDCGSIEGFLKANIRLALQDPKLAHCVLESIEQMPSRVAA